MPIINMEHYKEKEIKDLLGDSNRLKEKGFNPKLVIITDGVDDRCKTYMKSKLNHGVLVGIEVEVKTISTVSELDELLKDCFDNNTPTIMQLPIKKELELYYNDSSIAHKIDVDGFFSFTDLVNKEWDNAPCTPKGVMNYILDSNGLDLDTRDKHMVVVGRGMLTGAPLSIMSNQVFGTTTVLTSKTTRMVKRNALATADVIVLATGVKGSVKMSEIPKDRNVFVINVGTMFDENGKLTTELDVDCDRENVFYTDRIKAVGVLTVLSLMENVINYYKSVDKI
ncbi:MAG: hypothetical protein ACRCZ0_06750 [Cetobacterium sp.]